MGHDQLIRNETNPPVPGPFFAKLWLVIIFFGSSIIFNIFNSCVKVWIVFLRIKMVAFLSLTLKMMHEFDIFALRHPQ